MPNPSSKEPYSTARRRELYEKWEVQHTREHHKAQDDPEIDSVSSVFSQLTLDPSEPTSFTPSIPTAQFQAFDILPVDPDPPMEATLASDPPAEDVSLLDLQHVEQALLQSMLTFTPSGRRLHFIQDATARARRTYERHDPDNFSPSNSGFFALDARAEVNADFLVYESWLRVSYHSLRLLSSRGDEAFESLRVALCDQMLSELERLEDLKELDWEWDDRAASDGSRQGSVQTDSHFSRHPRTWTPDEAPIFASSLIAATLNLIYGVPNNTVRLVLAGLRVATRLTLQYARGSSVLSPEDERILRFMSKDPRTILRAFDLEPLTTSFICCPQCFALYAIDKAPKKCTHRAAPMSEPCGAKLWRKRTIRGHDLDFPVRKYLHQSLKEWLGRLLSREDIEIWLEKPRMGTGDGPMVDIFGAQALRSFLGPDMATPFLEAAGDELRLVFGLSCDSFNPYQMKEAKKKVSSTAIYLVCFNLPPHLRYLPENVCLVGVIPGPTKPSTSQINHFVALVVDDFLEFWQPGVFYSRTSRMPTGRRAQAALVPLICDLLAARQLSGLGPHNHTYTLCSLCHMLQGDIEETDMDQFQSRSPDAHRAAALAWRDAESTLEREELFRQNGIRYSELLRLPYWNPVLYVVVDSMHNLYLGLFQHHVRTIWGINVKGDDGEAAGSVASSRVPRPSSADMDKGLDILLYGSKEALLRCKKAVLYHLCADRDLRLAGTSAQLVRNILLWRTKEGLPTQRLSRENHESLAATVEAARPAAISAIPSLINPISHTQADMGGPSGSPVDPPVNPSATALAPSARGPSDLRHAASVSISGAGFAASALGIHIADGERALWSAGKPSTLKRLGTAVLQALCTLHGVQIGKTNAQMAEALLEWRNKNGGQQLRGSKGRGAHKEHYGRKRRKQEITLQGDEDVDGEETEKAGQDATSAAIGRATLESFAEDRERMELPSWVNAAPAAFGTMQHGKLSADQWRTVATVNLPITLIRTWGNIMDDLAHAFAGKAHDRQDDLRMRMLSNFLDLVDAVETIGQLQIDDNDIEHAEEKFVDYLEGLKALYKHTKFRPNHHLALHLGIFARLFGPVHSWRAFAFERLNYMYQNVNSSKIFGDMETAFLLSCCRAANFRPLLRSPPVMTAMQEFVGLHNKLSGEERRGMRFDDIFRSLGVDRPHGDFGTRSQQIRLDDAMVKALQNRLNAEIGEDFYIDSHRGRTRTSQVVLSRTAVVCSRVAVAGVFYKTSTRSRGDSHVIVAHALNPSASRHPARIEHIVLFNRLHPDGTHINETFLFVRRLLPLSVSDSKYDPFRRFPRVGGYLFYDRYADNLEAIRPTDVVCHFAKTRMDHLEVKERTVSAGQTHLRAHRFKHPCTHVLPLDRLLHGVNDFSSSEGEDDDVP